MTEKKKISEDTVPLRQQAEDKLKNQSLPMIEDIAAFSPEYIRKTLHELRVHQIELEIQNEELRAAQAGLEESRSRYFDLYDMAPVGYCTLSEQGQILEANLTAATLLGTPHNALVKDPISRFILNEDQDIYYLHRKKLLETGEPQECELRLVKSDGSRFWAHLKETATQAKDGAPVYRVMLSNITERKRAEMDLHSQKKLLEGVLDSIKDVIGVQLPDHTIVQYNRAGYELLGLTEDQVQGKKCYELLGRPGPCDICATSGSLISRTLVKVETYIPELGRHFLCTSNPVLDENGNIKLIIEQLTDITEKKKIDEMLHQAQKMESIGSLAGGIAHDFNNLLFPIIGLSEMMLEDFPPGSPEHYDIQQIFKAGKRGRELVQQILSFSRQSDYQLIPVHIQKILKEVLKLCRATIPADITIKQDIQTDCNSVMADPTQIHQIAMNLITNAFHAVEPTGGTIKVEFKEIDLCHEDDPNVQLASGRYAVLSVIDTGMGIGPAVINKIFDPYFTTKEKGRGTGLGLATVYGIVKTHGGDIRVHSEIGQGSSFHVYLPLLEKSADVAPEKQQQTATGTEHILLVDDEPPIVHLEKQMLERLGYRTTSFTSSVDALAAFETDPSQFDLVITDMHMPNLTGAQLAKKMVAVRPELPVIVCTGFSESFNREKADVMGIRGLLMKPVGLMDLAHKIREVLDWKKI